MKNLKNQVVLITGAGSGLGRLMAQRFAEEGSILLLLDIRLDLIEETKRLINASHPEISVRLYHCDLSEREEIYRVSETIIKELTTENRNVDVLVNNAGIVSGKPFLEVSDELVQKTMNVNVMAHMWLAKKFLPIMLNKNHGHLVTIASAAGIFGVAGLADYCASKFAAVGFDESLRQELLKLNISGVKTTCVCPFYINTGMFEGVKDPFLPLLEPKWVVDQIMKAIKNDKEVLYLPWSLVLFGLMKAVLPAWFSDWLGKFLGINKSMEDFKGRGTAWVLGSDTKKIEKKEN